MVLNPSNSSSLEQLALKGLKDYWIGSDVLAILVCVFCLFARVAISQLEAVTAGPSLLNAADVHAVSRGRDVDRTDSSGVVNVRLTLDMVKAQFAVVEANANAVDASKE